MKSTAGTRTYQESVEQGHYGLNQGRLYGKYDNVRTYWEDSLTQQFLCPHLATLAHQAQTENRRLRVLDLGSGAGQGYQMITQTKPFAADEFLISDNDLSYLGVDLSPAMVSQGQHNFANQPHIQFKVGDLREGIASFANEPAFDIYYSTYGSLSHLDYESVRELIAQIADHAHDQSLIVMDLIGRYSLEWPEYWYATTEADKVREYSMSYLYPPEERGARDIEKFMLRFWVGEDVHRLCSEIAEATSLNVNIVDMYTRSLMVGRHIDTCEYGTFLPPIRYQVNQLLESNLRTNLEDLLVTYEPHPKLPHLNQFFDALCDAWNSVVEFTYDKLQSDHSATPLPDTDCESTNLAITYMNELIDSVQFVDYEDVCASLIEPQLAYVLRQLEANMQQGQGCGHGLVAILQVEK